MTTKNTNNSNSNSNSNSAQKTTAANVYLEHANITVTNLDDTIQFFQTAFPSFKVRGGGTNEGRKWIHLGDEHTYLAINQGKTEEKPGHPNYHANGINHIGFVVGDVGAIAERLLAAQYKRDYPKQVQKYRIRDYFADADGNQYEFVQYLSNVLEERNSYND